MSPRFVDLEDQAWVLVGGGHAALGKTGAGRLETWRAASIGVPLEVSKCKIGSYRKTVRVADFLQKWSSSGFPQVRGAQPAQRQAVSQPVCELTNPSGQSQLTRRPIFGQARL